MMDYTGAAGGIHLQTGVTHSLRKEPVITVLPARAYWYKTKLENKPCGWLNIKTQNRTNLFVYVKKALIDQILIVFLLLPIQLL